jgi:mRNA interferase MazF
LKRPGQIALTPFPHTDLTDGKLRPVLLLRQASRRFDDWLVCMVSSRLDQADVELDEFVRVGDADFGSSGLKVSSVLRLSRLAVISGEVLVGAIGEVDAQRLQRARQRLGRWLSQDV